MSLLVIQKKVKHFFISFLEFTQSSHLSLFPLTSLKKWAVNSVITELVSSGKSLLNYPGSAREGWIAPRCQKKTNPTNNKPALQDWVSQQTGYMYDNKCDREVKIQNWWLEPAGSQCTLKHTGSMWWNVRVFGWMSTTLHLYVGYSACVALSEGML